MKQFWVHYNVEKESITSYVMNRKIVITEKSIVDLISHIGRGKIMHSVKTNEKREAIITSVISKVGTNLGDDKSPSAKDLTNSLRVWFKIIMDCIHHSSGTKGAGYVNTLRKFVLGCL